MDEERKIGQTLSTTFLRHPTTSDNLELSVESAGLQRNQRTPFNEGLGKHRNSRGSQDVLHNLAMLFSSFFVAILVSIGRMHDQSIDIPMENYRKKPSTLQGQKPFAATCCMACILESVKLVAGRSC